MMAPSIGAAGEFEARYHAIVSEARGRRLFPASPRSSLILTKAAGQVAHGGGKRLAPDSEGYQTLLRWLEQGTPRGDADAPTIVREALTIASGIDIYTNSHLTVEVLP